MRKYPKIALLCLFIFISAIIAGCGNSATENSNDVATGAKNSSGKVDVSELLTKAKDVKGFSAEVFISAIDSKLEQKIAMQGDNFRIEMKDPTLGINTITIINSGKNIMYMYQPDENTAFEMDLSAGELGTGEDISPTSRLDDLDAANMKYLGEEKIDGKNCYMFEINEDGNPGKVWLWKDYGFPLKMEMYEDGEIMTIEYKNVKIQDIPSSQFELPAGVEIMDFGF